MPIKLTSTKILVFLPAQMVHSPLQVNVSLAIHLAVNVQLLILAQLVLLDTSLILNVLLLVQLDSMEVLLQEFAYHVTMLAVLAQEN